MEGKGGDAETYTQKTKGKLLAGSGHGIKESIFP